MTIPDQSLNNEYRKYFAAQLFGFDMSGPPLLHGVLCEFTYAVPKGWMRQSQVSHSLAAQKLLGHLHTFSVPGPMVRPGMIARLGHDRPGIYDFFFSQRTDAGVISSQECLLSAATIAMARTAIRIEQHRRLHGALPAALSDLSSPALPDPMTGLPLHYVCLDATRYKLWSVALDGKDDGGSIGPLSISRYGRHALDWVWISDLAPGSKP